MFLKLCNPSPIERYTSEKALRHPWITRNFKADVPLTQSEEIREFQTEINLRLAIGISYFMSVTKSKDLKASQGMKAYLEKCRKVALDSSS